MSEEIEENEEEVPEDEKQRKEAQRNIPELPKREKIMPIIIWRKRQMGPSKQGARQTKNKFHQGKSVKSGIQLKPATENDYRKMYKLFEKIKVQLVTVKISATTRF